MREDGAVADAPPEDDVDEGSARSPSEPRPFGLPAGIGSVDLAAAALLLAVPLVAFPVVDQPTWSIRTAVGLVLVGPGVVLLADLARRRDRAAQAALLFLMAAVVSAALAPVPRIAFIGSYGVDRGVLVLATYIGSWALGRRVNHAAHGLLVGAYLVAATLSVSWGILQVAWGQQLGALGVADGRAAGFTASSVYLGGIVAGALAVVGYLCAHCETRDRRLVGLLLLAAFLSLGANLSGSRIALIGGILIALAAAVRVNWRIALMLALALALGVVASRAVPQSQSTTNRIAADTSSGIKPRIIMWRAGVEALAHRPVLGYGPGGFRAATSSRVTPDYVIAEGQDRLFFDAHDVVIEQATTVGVVGLALLAAFVFLAARRAQGPMAWLAVGVAVTWLLEPVSISTGPVALLALGAAAPMLSLPLLPRLWRGAAAVLALASLVLAGVFLSGMYEMKLFINPHGPASALHTARRRLPPDAVIDSLVLGDVEKHLSNPLTAADKARVLAASRRLVADDPGRPDWWTALGVSEQVYGSPARAKAAYLKALKLDPWSQSALVDLHRFARTTGDHALAESTHQKLCRIRSGGCALP